ncbi:hypothetical protein GCM10011403_16110 [Pseudohongiella nitratireducens]|uniref:Uncharacterized protein n=1 Tax=Pseudohongiella nitratireducens TaxID=1768907 RepID=A0A917LVM6_9GAMM|nr:hypothetical protein [Pseudohongiella nitratireducens]GGG59559.1 hypothetical protein GCM10011403_16110 [Pseudohongiella nitratireducens]
MRDSSLRSIALRMVLLLTLPFFSCLVQATTITELHFSEVVAKAQLVFEGRVTDVQAQQTGPRMINTLVTFKVIDVIKGQVEETTITLHYTGGRVGQRQLMIADMQIPEVGETGVYFVSSLQNNLVHPLVGWSQGHFRVDEQSQSGNVPPENRRIMTASGRPVSSLPTTRPDVDNTAPLPLLAPGAAARGVQVLGASQPEQALTVEAFKSGVRQMLREQEGS